MGSILSSNVANMTEEEAGRYRTFLESELKKIDGKKKRSKKIDVD